MYLRCALFNLWECSDGGSVRVCVSRNNRITDMCAPQFLVLWTPDLLQYLCLHGWACLIGRDMSRFMSVRFQYYCPIESLHRTDLYCTGYSTDHDPKESFFPTCFTSLLCMKGHDIEQELVVSNVVVHSFITFQISGSVRGFITRQCVLSASWRIQRHALQCWLAAMQNWQLIISWDPEGR